MGLDGYKLSSESWQPDYSRSLLKQLWNTKITRDQYVRFIQEPKHLINPVRDVILFDHPFLEFFTKTPWYAIPIAWAPFITYYTYLSQVDLFSTIFWLFVGVINWSLLEYLIHRFVFHGEDYWLGESRVQFYAHFLLHGIHHAFPQDAHRLVFPVLPGYIVMNLILAPSFRIFLPVSMADPFIAGSILGYVLYDLIHYFIHHSSPREGYWKDVKIYHMQHHYKDGENGYGVSQKFWDLVFKTEL